jgi:membrane protein DedA with SNARE-associated domain
MVLGEIYSMFLTYINMLTESNLNIGAFFAMFIETIFPPIPSELIMPSIGYIVSLRNLSYLGLITTIISGTCGASLGATVIYYFSLKLGRKFIVKYGRYFMMSEKKISSAEDWFKKYGTKAVFFGRMAPGIRELISVPAGLSAMNFKSFLVYTFAGSFVWTAFLASIGYFLGKAWQNIPISEISDVLLWLIPLSILLYLVYKYWLKKKLKRN